MHALSSVKAFLLDLDGTLYLGNKLFSGTLSFLSTLQERKIPFYLFTNNSSKSKGEYLEKLCKLGIIIEPEQLFTSGEIAADLIAARWPNLTFFVLGTRALKKELHARGIQTGSQAQGVLLGFDTELTYKKLRVAANLLAGGAVYVATHPDVNCPDENGFLPDAGSLAALLEVSAGKRPMLTAGKPTLAAHEYILRKTGLPAEQLCMVGDRLQTDIALGQNGIRTALVLSGVTTEADLQASGVQPDFVFKDISALRLALLNAAG